MADPQQQYQDGVRKGLASGYGGGLSHAEQQGWNAGVWARQEQQRQEEQRKQQLFGSKPTNYQSDVLQSSSAHQSLERPVTKSGIIIGIFVWGALILAGLFIYELQAREPAEQIRVADPFVKQQHVEMMRNREALRRQWRARGCDLVDSDGGRSFYIVCKPKRSAIR